MTSTPLVGTTFFGLDIGQLTTQLMSVRRRLSKRLLLLEFSASGLRYAEAAPSLDGIRFSHISRVTLPDEALERGVPSDPSMMASLIKELCTEKGIPAHRAAVVLSPDVAYQRIVNLPSDLSPEQARLYLADPVNSVPLPFPLEQTDFDLFPLPHRQEATLRPYLLIAIPQSLIDRVISLLDEAGFELQALELGPFSLLRFLADELISLAESELHLVLELLPDCSQLCVVGPHGPIRFERLSAIRDFPDPDLDDEQRKVALDSGLSAEEITLKDERYLPISELDLRAVLRDVKAVIAELMASSESFVVSGLSLSGNNSAHPLLKELFHEALGCDVKLISSILMPRVAGFSPDDVLVQAGLSRLIGLGLGFLPHEQLLSCQLPEIASTSALSPLSSLLDDPIIDLQEKASSSPDEPLEVEVIQPSSSGLSKVDDEVLLEKDEEVVGELSVEVEEAVESEGEEEWPSLGLELLEKDEEAAAELSVEVEKAGESEGEEEWPSLGLELLEKDEEAAAELSVEVEKAGESEGEEEWPSLGLELLEKDEEAAAELSVEVEKAGESEGEEEWPSVKSIPGLESSKSQSLPKKMQAKSRLSPEVDDSFDSSSLGELRFQDD